MFEIWSKLTIKTPERRRCRYNIFIANFEQISHKVLGFPLLNLNKFIPGGLDWGNDALLLTYFPIRFQCKKNVWSQQKTDNNFEANSADNFLLIHCCRSNHRRCSNKKGVLKNFAVFTGKHLCWNLLLIKLQAFRPATLLKRDSNKGVFLWILPNFYEHVFWRTSANGCFWFWPNQW